MGLLTRMMGKSDLEQRLEDFYVAVYQQSKSLSVGEARQIVRDLIRQAKEEIRQHGEYPANFGDQLLAREATDEKTRTILARKRRDGVRDEDIRWWWNLPDLERRLALKDDDLTRVTAYVHHRQQGLDEKAAASRIHQYYPMYGDPDDEELSSGDDCPLPEELKDRVNRYIQKRIVQDPEAYKAEIERSSTFNALIRAEIQAGRV